MQTKVRKLLFYICALVALGCTVWLAIYFIQINKAKNLQEDLSANYVSPLPESSEAVSSESEHSQELPEESSATDEPTTSSESESALEVSGTESQVPDSGLPGLTGYDVPLKDIDFAALKSEQNEHIYAWITVPGTVIDYPVLQHPEEIGYYLDRNLDHSKGYPGCIYSQLYNSKEWDDPMTVLYGHNMKNGTMFAGLHKYRDSQFFEENQYVYIYTEDKIRVYQIFAAYEYSDVDLVLMRIYGGEAAYTEYLDSIYTLDGMNNNFNTDIEITAEDKILTLCTCISNKPKMRYLVQAVLVAEGGQ